MTCPMTTNHGLQHLFLLLETNILPMGLHEHFKRTKGNSFYELSQENSVSVILMLTIFNSCEEMSTATVKL